MESLQRRTRRIFAFRKGILALDTDPAILGVRFDQCTAEPAPEVDAYLDMLLSTPELANAVSAVVLCANAFEADDRDRLDRLREAGVLLGARADTGAEQLSPTVDELVTSGLDGLDARLRRLRERGAGLAVWSMSSGSAIDYGALRTLTVNSQAAARFAYTCQSAGLVPVIRVGTRMRTGTPAQRSAARAAALLSVCGHLEDLDVDLPSVVVCTEAEHSAADDPVTASPLVALPGRLGGVALTSGGNSLRSAATAVAAVCSSAPPWPVGFYLGREVTKPALQAWCGDTGSVRAGQQALRDGLATATAALGGEFALAAVPGT